MAVLENNHTRNNSQQGLLVKRKGNPFYRNEKTPRVKHWGADNSTKFFTKGDSSQLCEHPNSSRLSTEMFQHTVRRRQDEETFSSSLLTSLLADKAVRQSPAQPHPGSQRRAARQREPLSESNPTGGITPWVEDIRSLRASLWCRLCRCFDGFIAW